jgi:hypothetical protein
LSPLPPDIDFESVLFIVLFLTWALAVAFALVRAWQMAVQWKANRWRFSARQLFVVMTAIAIILGLAVTLARW